MTGWPTDTDGLEPLRSGLERARRDGRASVRLFASVDALATDEDVVGGGSMDYREGTAHVDKSGGSPRVQARVGRIGRALIAALSREVRYEPGREWVRRQGGEWESIPLRDDMHTTDSPLWPLQVIEAVVAHGCTALVVGRQERALTVRVDDCEHVNPLGPDRQPLWARVLHRRPTPRQLLVRATSDDHGRFAEIAIQVEYDRRRSWYTCRYEWSADAELVE